MAKMNGIGIKVNCIIYFSLNAEGGETKRIISRANKTSCYASTLGNTNTL